MEVSDWAEAHRDLGSNRLSEAAYRAVSLGVSGRRSGPIARHSRGGRVQTCAVLRSVDCGHSTGRVAFACDLGSRRLVEVMWRTTT